MCVFVCTELRNRPEVTYSMEEIRAKFKQLRESRREEEERKKKIEADKILHKQAIEKMKAEGRAARRQIKQLRRVLREMEREDLAKPDCIDMLGPKSRQRQLKKRKLREEKNAKCAGTRDDPVKVDVSDSDDFNWP